MNYYNIVYNNNIIIHKLFHIYTNNHILYEYIAYIILILIEV